MPRGPRPTIERGRRRPQFRLDARRLLAGAPRARRRPSRERCRTPSTPTCSTRAPRTSTSTAASACSPRRSATASATTVRITTVESDARATEHAAENLADWVGARAVTARVDRFLRELAADAGSGGASAARATPRSCSTRRAPAPAGQVVDALAELAPAPARLRRLRSRRARPRRRAPRERGYELTALRRVRPVPEHAPRRGGRPTADARIVSTAPRSTGGIAVIGTKRHSDGAVRTRRDRRRPRVGAARTAGPRAATPGYEVVAETAATSHDLLEALGGRDVRRGRARPLARRRLDGDRERASAVQATGAAVLVHSIADRVAARARGARRRSGGRHPQVVADVAP